MDIKFSFGRVYTLLYYLIVLPVSVILILVFLVIGFLSAIFKGGHFVLNSQSQVFSYYLEQTFKIENYLLCIPIFLLTTIFLIPKHFNFKKLFIINISGFIILTLWFIFRLYNTMTSWDNMANIVQGMKNIKYEYFRSGSPDVIGYSCVTFDIDPNKKVEIRNLITERIKNVEPNLVFNYGVGQQTIYDVKILDSIKNDLRGSICR